ncbi:MAG: cobalamin biosynthesis protein [Brooklawnia sp.]|jgi:adenosylcobinamide-phosphate synthase
MNHALGLLLGVVADAAIGDPRRGHPVALFGKWASHLERHLHRDSIAAGALYLAAALAPVAALGVAAESISRRRPILHTALTAAATWAVLGAHSLASEGEQMADELDQDDLGAARERLTHLCSRDPSGLSADELARGTVESLAENTADAVVCSLFWGAAFGIPGLLLHRGINTLDAMVGYRNHRYERFGKAAALLDDAVAYVPARLAGAVSCLLAPAVGGSTRTAWRVMLRDSRNHPSPNGGWTEAAWAGALAVRLGGPSHYHGRVEHRPYLGDEGAPGPDSAAIRKAARLVGSVTAASTAVAVAVRLSRPMRTDSSRGCSTPPFEDG